MSLFLWLWPSVAVLVARVPLTQRAFRSSADARVTFLLLAQKKSNPKKMALRAKARSDKLDTSAIDQRSVGMSRDLPPTQRLHSKASMRRGLKAGVAAHASGLA